MLLRIKDIRKRKKISQKDLADESGISVRMLSDYENGVADISLSKLQNIADVLGCSISDLIADDKGTNVVAGNGSYYYSNNPNSVMFQTSVGNDIEKIQFLERLLAEKERTIKLLENILEKK